MKETIKESLENDEGKIDAFIDECRTELQREEETRREFRSKASVITSLLTIVASILFSSRISHLISEGHHSQILISLLSFAILILYTYDVFRFREYNFPYLELNEQIKSESSKQIRIGLIDDYKESIEKNKGKNRRIRNSLQICYSIAPIILIIILSTIYPDLSKHPLTTPLIFFVIQLYVVLVFEIKYKFQS